MEKEGEKRTTDLSPKNREAGHSIGTALLQALKYRLSVILAVYKARGGLPLPKVFYLAEVERGYWPPHI
jgi:hypothetical protein